MQVRQTERGVSVRLDTQTSRRNLYDHQVIGCRDLQQQSNHSKQKPSIKPTSTSASFQTPTVKSIPHDRPITVTIKCANNRHRDEDYNDRPDADRPISEDPHWSVRGRSCASWHIHRSRSQERGMEKNVECNTGIGRGINRSDRRHAHRNAVQFIRKNDSIKHALLPFSSMFSGGWNWKGPAFHLIPFSLDDIVKEIQTYIHAKTDELHEFTSTLFESITQLVLHTPITLLSNLYVQKLWWVFLGITVAMLMVMCVVEGIRMALGISKDGFLYFIGRTFMAFLGISVALPTMVYSLDGVNRFVDFLLDQMFQTHGTSVSIGESLRETLASAGLGIITTFIFFVLFLFYMFKLVLIYGRRWFDLIASTIISPLALGALSFQSTAPFFGIWWKNVVHLYLMQIVHTVYIGILSIIVLAPNFFADANMALAKLILIIGGLWRISSPPNFMKNYGGDAKVAWRMVKGMIAKRWAK